MTVIKRAAVIVLLLALSATAVFGPQLINTYSVHRRLSHTEHWKYAGADSSKITDAQVAQLYSTTGLLGGSFAGVIDHETDESEREQDMEEVRVSAQRLLKKVFGEDKGIYKFFDATTEAVCVVLDRSYICSVQDDAAAVLSFVSVYYEQKDGTTLDITFEEKTGTLVRLIFCGLPDSVPVEVFSAAWEMLDHYFAAMGISRSDYRCRRGLSDGKDTVSFVEAYILSEGEKKDMSEELGADR